MGSESLAIFLTPAGLGMLLVGGIVGGLLALAFFAVGCGAALAVPAANALGSLSVSREEQGAAAALLAAAPPAGFIFGPLIGAMLYSFMPELPLYVSAALVGTLAIYAILVTSKRPLTPS